jgi:hypothetical protein
MRKKITVLDFAVLVDCMDPIPVKIVSGSEIVAKAKSLSWLASHGSPGILESKIMFVTLKREEIFIQIRMKSYMV